MTHLSILHQLLKFLQKGCSAVKRGWIFSNKDTFDFFVAFRLVHGKKTPHSVYSSVFYLSAALSTPKQRSSAEVIPSPVSPWHGLTASSAL